MTGWYSSSWKARSLEYVEGGGFPPPFSYATKQSGGDKTHRPPDTASRLRPTKQPVCFTTERAVCDKYVSLARKRHPNLFRAKSYSPHSMRHSTATHMLEAGVPLIVIKNFLGHSSLQTTQVYAAVSQCTLNKHIQDWNKKWFSDDGSLEHQLKAEIPSFLI